MAVVSISEASRLVGKTRQTLYNDRDSGKLSGYTGGDTIPGDKIFTIAAADTIVPQINQDLLIKYFPGVPVSPKAGTHDSLLSIEKAKRVLGYKPKYTWRKA